MKYYIIHIIQCEEHITATVFTLLDIENSGVTWEDGPSPGNQQTRTDE